MNWENIKGKWKELSGHAKKKWGKLTDDDLEQIQGDRDKLIGRLEQAYGHKREAAEKEVDAWAEALHS